MQQPALSAQNIPMDVYQLAASRQLGTPTKEYRVGLPAADIPNCTVFLHLTYEIFTSKNPYR